VLGNRERWWDPEVVKNFLLGVGATLAVLVLGLFMMAVWLGSGSPGASGPTAPPAAASSANEAAPPPPDLT
jgi:hypothetical protein